MGLTVVVGVNAGIDLRLLGVAREVPLAPMTRLFPIMWIAFAVNVMSGSILLAADATTKMTSPVFYIKMVFITLAILDLWILRTRVFEDPQLDQKPVSRNVKLLAAASIICWLGAITGGRLMAYLGPVSGLE
jgi:hypothetical protein